MSTPTDQIDCETLFLKREIQDEALISKCKTVLDHWSDQIPFSPIKKLGTKTEFLSATEYAAYKTTVTSQIEKRWLKDHEEPYREQDLPSKFRAKSQIDPWQMDFPQFADFTPHQHSKDLFETRQVYDCPGCNASGCVTCPSCAGRGEVKCGSCGGSGFKKCRECGGKGQIRETRNVPRQVNCSACSGRGRRYSSRLDPDEPCPRCGGKGTEIKNFQEPHYIRCGGCANKGEVRCAACHSTGKVTCRNCTGSGKVTCTRCEGASRLMTYASTEQTEEPAKNEHQYIPDELPKFKKIDNPLTNLAGDSVFLQDEKCRIPKLGIGEQPAAAVLSAEFELSRQPHDELSRQPTEGRVLRQQINVERCSIVEYRYRFEKKDYSIFLNPAHALVEDVSGPIQAEITKMDTLAQKAFDEKRYEEAYRLNLRSLCMDEASKDEKKLRAQILKKLMWAYCSTSMLTWFAASLAWLDFHTTAQGRQGNIGGFLGIFPLLGGVYLFAHDLALRFQQRIFRVFSAVLIGFSAFLSGTTINLYSFQWNPDHPWVDWIPFGIATLGLCAFGIIRTKERSRRTQIEKHIQSFPDKQALEAYVCGLDPRDGTELMAALGMCVTVFCLLGSATWVYSYQFQEPLLVDVKTELDAQSPIKTSEENPQLVYSRPRPAVPAASDSNVITANAQSSRENLSAGVDDIVKLSKAHMNDDLILKFATNSGIAFNLTADDLLYLNRQGVSDNVILTLLHKKSQGGHSAPP
jgi:hypothetical protein